MHIYLAPCKRQLAPLGYAGENMNYPYDESPIQSPLLLTPWLNLMHECRNMLFHERQDDFIGDFFVC
jgi:hypothetical protein